MAETINAYPIYDLCNLHFQDVELQTKTGVIKGQFVKFKVVEGIIEYIYPSEKYCFLPEEKRKLFWEKYKLNNGEFSELPEYIKEFGLNEIEKIVIYPKLIV